MATAHIESKKEEIAPIVIMPGDPLRAKFIAETLLEEATCVNRVRNMLGYTGTYKGKKITVFASGMGMPSIGIYSYELFKEYNVQKIIRVGTAGSYKEDLHILDIVLVDKAYSDSSFALVQNGTREHSLSSSETLNQKIEATANKLSIPIYRKDVYSTDVFYNDIESPLIKELQLSLVEMESFALFHHAKIFGREAACLLTISNNFATKEETTPEVREKGFIEMIKLALESCL